MADQMRITPDPDSEREVDWGERLLASMNETSAEADEPDAPVLDEEDDLAALLRAQLARQKEDPIPDLLDTTEFEEDEEETLVDGENFDDEELDRFKGKEQKEYTEEEIEEFRQVLYTMKPEEVDLWVHCLQTRGIEMPSAVKDEVLLMLQ